MVVTQMESKMQEVTDKITKLKDAKQKFKLSPKPTQPLSSELYGYSKKPSEAKAKEILKLIEQNKSAINYNQAVESLNASLSISDLEHSLSSILSNMSLYKGKYKINLDKRVKCRAVLTNPKRWKEHPESNKQLEKANKQLAYSQEQFEIHYKKLQEIS